MKSVLLLFIFLLSFSTYSQDQLSPEQWRGDLEFLQNTIHQDYSFLFKKTTAQEFDAAVENLHDSIPFLQDHEIVVGFSKIIALFKYGHTDISFSHPPYQFRHLPYNLYQFGNDIYIQGTHVDHQEALGAKVLAVEGMPIDKALKTVYPVVNVENEQYFKAYGINYLRLPEVLHATGITTDLSDKVSLRLEKDGRSFTYEFTALPKGEYIPIQYSLVPQEGGWLDAREQSSTPHYLRNLDKHYYFEILPDGKTMYVRQSSVFHDPSEDIPSFYNRVFQAIEENDLEKMVLDLRLNGGGNNFNNKEVVRGIVQSKKIDQVGKLFVIIGRRTFSACQNLVLELDNYTNAIFVGEPTSENINFYGDNNELALPNSGIPVYLSWAWWQDKPQWQNGPWMAPHIAVEMDFDEYSTNQDPVLATALNFSAEGFITDPMLHMAQLYESGQFEKLMSDAQRMIADPAYRFFNFEAELNKTGYRVLAGKSYGEAIGIFSFVTQLFPDSANAWDSLAEGYMEAGDMENAVRYYSKALEMDPDGPTGKNASTKLEKIKIRKL